MRFWKSFLPIVFLFAGLSLAIFFLRGFLVSYGLDIKVLLWGNGFLFVLSLVSFLIQQKGNNPAEMNAEEEDPDVYYISRTESHINVKSWIYEFINLSIPLQHTCTNNPDGSSGCNQEALEMLKKLTKRDPGSDNPIWKGLDKFRNN